MLVGDFKYGAVAASSTMYAGMFHMGPGVDYPCHSHEPNEEFLILSNSDAEWRVDGMYDTPTTLPAGTRISIPPNTPHSVRTRSQALLVWYFWTGSLKGGYRFCDHGLAAPVAVASGNKHTNINKLAMADAEAYYDKMAEEYEATVRGWGYMMPELVASKALELAPGSLRVLDLGCGDGLVGVAFGASARTLQMTGVDVSGKMLQTAAKRKCYASLVKADLSKRLPLPDASYDMIVCVGTTSYLEPAVLADWLRIVRVGGLVGFTHKTVVWPTWEPAQERLLDEGAWSLVYMSDKLQYLPGYDENARLNERAKIYFYRRRR